MQEAHSGVKHLSLQMKYEILFLKELLETKRNINRLGFIFHLKRATMSEDSSLE